MESFFSEIGKIAIYFIIAGAGLLGFYIYGKKNDKTIKAEDADVKVQTVDTRDPNEPSGSDLIKDIERGQDSSN